MSNEGIPNQPTKPEELSNEVDLKAEQETIYGLEKKFEKVSWNEELLKRWLKRFYGIEVDIKENNDGSFQLQTEALPNSIPELPQNYGVMGGAARFILKAALSTEAEKPRDIDIVFLGKGNQDEETSRALAEKYMPEDFRFGHSIQKLDEDYFTTRDFTWNEVIYANDKVTFSKQCLLDTVRNIVRISDYEKMESYSGEPFFVKPKLLSKALRFIALARARGNKKAKLSDETSEAIEMGIDYWHIALHLNRSYEESEKVAQEYVDELVKRQLLPHGIHNPIDALRFLSKETTFIFRSEAASVLDKETELAKNLNLEGYDYAEEEYDSHPQIVPFWRPVK